MVYASYPVLAFASEIRNVNYTLPLGSANQRLIDQKITINK